MDKVKDIFGLGELEGDIGFEIEVEGRNLPIPSERDKHWRRIRDGSLQGDDTGEFIFRTPLSLSESKVALGKLKEYMARCDTEVYDSVRAGIHVHLNAQRMTMVQVYNLVVLYLILEEILVSEPVCGKGREGNLFCLRASDAEYLTYYLTEVAKSKRWDRLRTDEIRYASINLKCLVELGSVEFRALRTTTDFDAVYKWIQTLHSLRESAKNFRCPEDIIANFSEAMGPQFMQMVLGDLAKPYLQIPDLGVRIKNGMRNAQDVAFAIDWRAYAKELEAVKDSRNPFLAGKLRGQHQRDGEPLPEGLLPPDRGDGRGFRNPPRAAMVNALNGVRFDAPPPRPMDFDDGPEPAPIRPAVEEAVFGAARARAEEVLVANNVAPQPEPQFPPLRVRNPERVMTWPDVVRMRDEVQVQRGISRERAENLVVMLAMEHNRQF